MRAAAQTNLFEPGEYLNTERPGYFARLWKEPEKDARQEMHKLIHLPQVVKLLNPKVDTWISQATFEKKSRKAVNVQDVGLLFSDLDTYHAEHLNGLTPEQQSEKLCQFCRDEGLPEPSLVMFSGRGLQVKWLLTQPQPRINVCTWNEAQKALLKLLEPFASDPKAIDISRVLRLDRTVNTKSGEVCRIVHVTGGNENCLARYDFTELSGMLIRRADAVRERIEKTGRQHVAGKLVTPLRKRSKRRGKLIPMEFATGHTRDTGAVRRWQDLAWKRVNDIRKIWEIRGGVPKGYREVTLFWELNFLLLAQPVRGNQLYHEAAALAREISPETFYGDSDLSTLYRKAREYLSGTRVEFKGLRYPPFYTPRNTTLLEIFRVTMDEEMHLTTIISQNEKNRRRREKARAAGAMERAEYESQSVNRLKPWEAEGISRAWWYKKQRESRQVPSVSWVYGF